MRVADNNPVELQDMLPSDGRLKFAVFPGAAATPEDVHGLQGLADQLSGVLGKYPKGMFDVFTVFKEIPKDVGYLDVPAQLRSSWMRYVLDQVERT